MKVAIGEFVLRRSKAANYIALLVLGAKVANLCAQPADHLVISEFMADNKSTLADQDGDFSGWIEIHNPTSTAVNLAGYFLTDDENEPTKWKFPNLTLIANGYAVVFASGKN